MPTARLRSFLEANNIQYKLINHLVTFTSRETAHAAHIPVKRFAKSVIVKIDGILTMVVIPADEQLDLRVLRRVTHAQRVELAAEEEFRGRFPDCEAGAEPPFGNLYGLPVFIARSLASNDPIGFNAGNHHEMVSLPYQTYERLVSPQAIPYPC